MKAARKRPTALAEYDINLIHVVSSACDRLSVIDFVEEVFRLPSVTRRKLSALLCSLSSLHNDWYDPDTCSMAGADAATTKQHAQIKTNVLNLLRAAGCYESLCEAFFLTKDEWRARFSVGSTQWCARQVEDAYERSRTEDGARLSLGAG